MSVSLGLIGLGKMGANLALNISKNKDLNIYNRTTAKTYQICEKNRVRLNGFSNVESFMESTQTPRTIITMLPNGVDFDNFLPLMSPGDVIIDCANEHYDVSHEKKTRCDQWDVDYLGVGMSGGAMGALHGPAVMVGGSEEVWEAHKPLFDSFCKNVVYMGPEPDVGHFTKMVHNGIEYSMLQCIADIYSYCGHNWKVTSHVLERTREVDGYLVRSALSVFETYQVNNIVDICQMNNTGLWCSQYALEHGIPLTTIHTSVQYRINSSYKSEKAQTKRKIDYISEDAARGAMKFIFAMALLEGTHLIDTHGIDVNTARQAWSRHTIIRCNMLKHSTQELLNILDLNIYHLRHVVRTCVINGINVPLLSAALQHYDFINTKQTQMSLIMAQRNYFGNHEICLHKQSTS